MNRKAIVMLSGGLDSTLAAKLMLEQGIECIGINFVSIFCTCTSRRRKEAGCASEALKTGKELGIPVHTYAKGMEYFAVVQNPKYGYGKGMNPCIDCRIYILNKAKELMSEYGASFIVTGEVVGQRPMSQQRHQLKIIEKQTGLAGLILRPLSAHLLPETIPEQQGIVDRTKLLNISGRSRKQQIELAESSGITDYPCAAGGCLLTDKIFAQKLKDLFDHKKEYTMIDLKLLKIGRHFRINEDTKIILGRDQSENMMIESLGAGFPLFRPVDIPGPTAAVDGILNDEVMNELAKLMLRYSDATNEREIKLLYKYRNEQKQRLFTVH